jgi:hypothetical protein
METIFDDFSAQIQSDELTAPFEPTAQDLLDMEIAWQTDQDSLERELDELCARLGGASQANEWLIIDPC